MDYALSANGGKGWKGVRGKIVVFSSLNEARETANRIATNIGSNVTIGRVSWAKDYYGGKMGIKNITVVETVAPKAKKKVAVKRPK